LPLVVPEEGDASIESLATAVGDWLVLVMETMLPLLPADSTDHLAALLVPEAFTSTDAS